jgi:hypothetical protein
MGLWSGGAVRLSSSAPELAAPQGVPASRTRAPAPAKTKIGECSAPATPSPLIASALPLMSPCGAATSRSSRRCARAGRPPRRSRAPPREGATERQKPSDSSNTTRGNTFVLGLNYFDTVDNGDTEDMYRLDTATFEVTPYMRGSFEKE